MKRSQFDVLYREHFHRVCGLCRRLLAAAQGEAEDAAQEAFMRAYGSFDQFRSGQPFGAWINRIASNYCIDLLRQRQRWATVVDADVEAEQQAAEEAEYDPAAPLISAWEAETVANAISALPERYRLPLVMAYYAEASYDEIAESLGLNRNHVGVLLLRGRERLRKELAAAGFDNPETQEKKER